MQSANLVSPLKQTQRVAIVDIPRAYALLGVAIINYTSFKNSESSNGSSIDAVLRFISIYIFIINQHCC